MAVIAHVAVCLGTRELLVWFVKSTEYLKSKKISLGIHTGVYDIWSIKPEVLSTLRLLDPNLGGFSAAGTPSFEGLFAADPRHF